MNVKDPLFADSDRFASVARETPPERLGVRTQATRDHEAIRRWATEHQAEPATREATESGPAKVVVNDGGGRIRFNFPDSHRSAQSPGMSGLLISTETTFCLCSKNRIRRKLRRAPTNSPTRAAASLATIEKTGFRRNATCANRRAEGLRHCGIVSLGKTQHLSANRSVQDIVRATRSVIDLVGRCLRQPRTRPCSRAPGPSVLSPDDSHEVQFEGRVHGAKRLAGEIDRARLPEHVLGEDVDASPARRRATEHVEGRLLGQLPDAHPRKFWSDLGDPGLHLPGRFSHSGSWNTCASTETAARRNAAMIIVGLHSPGSVS